MAGGCAGFWPTIARAIGSAGQRMRRGLVQTVSGRRQSGGSLSWQEVLEPRLAFDVSYYHPPYQAGNDNWVAVTVDQGSDAYIRHASNATDDLQIGDNASFFGRLTPQISFSNFDELRVYEGTPTTVSDVREIGYPAEPTGELRFIIPYTIVNPDFLIDGVLELPGGGRLEFTNQGRGTSFTVTGGGSGTLEGRLAQGRSYGSELILSSQTLLGVDAYEVGSVSPKLTISFYNSSTNTSNNTPWASFRATASDLPAVVGTARRFAIADPSAGVYAPGTLRGTLNLELPTNLPTMQAISVPFQVETASVGSDIPLSFQQGTNPRSSSYQTVVYYRENNASFNGFVNVADDLRRVTEVSPQGTNVRYVSTILRVRGTFSSEEGTVVLDVDYGYNQTVTQVVNGQNNTTVQFVSLGQSYPLAVTVDATLAIYDPSSTALPPSFTLAAGGDHTKGLIVELPTPGAAVRLQNPVLASDTSKTSRSRVQLAASGITIDSPLYAAGQFVVPRELDSAMGAVPEVLTVNAPVSSQRFVIELDDDPGTGAIGRSQLVIGQTGSLSARANVLVPATGPLPPAQSVFVNVENGDIYLAGQVVANNHFYGMVSPTGSELEAPYTFATESPVTGVATGKIIGNSVAISLANDTHGTFYDSITESRLAINTDIARLRVQAGSRLGDPLEVPFPYELSVREDNALIIDAVASSSGAISIETGGKLDLLATVRSFDDVNIQSSQDFTVQAPMYTAFGTIHLQAPQVTVNNEVRVLDGIQDERQVDVSMVAENGPLVLNDAVLGINEVSLESRGATGAIIGSARVFGDIVSLASDGDVGSNATPIRTQANIVLVETPGAVHLEEEDNAAFEVRTSPTVSLAVGGRDAPAGGQVSPALYADLYDTKQLVVSAPNGSIDVQHNGVGTLTVGDRNALTAGGQIPDAMTAAGSVVIRSNNTSNIDVFDAPIAGQGGVPVRTVTNPAAAFTKDKAIYYPGRPGVFGTYLTATVSVVDGKLPAFGGVEASGVFGLRSGDRVLVKDGEVTISDLSGDSEDSSGIFHGVYVVLRTRFESTDEMTVSLARATAFDETSELEDKHYVRVADGDFRGAVYTSDGFVTIAPNAAAPTPIVVGPVVARTGYVVARASTNRVLTVADVEYSPADGGTIVLSRSRIGFIGSSADLFDNVVLGQNDLVVIRDGVADGSGVVDPTSPGIYSVVDGGGVTKSWKLKRYQGIDGDGDGNVEPVFVGVVAINEGSQRTALTGEMMEVSYDAMHSAALQYHQLTDFRQNFNLTDPSAASFDPTKEYRLDIGSENPYGLVTFRTATEQGTNQAAGSFGKSLTLVQQNTAFVNRLNQPQAYAAVIEPNVQRVVLEQGLPTISTPLSIDGGDRLTLDGSQIAYTRDGAFVRNNSIVAVNVGPVRPSEGQGSRRLVRTAGRASLTEVNGLVLQPSAAGTTVANLSIGGFRNGAGIIVSGAQNVGINNVLVGRDYQGNRTPNQFGVVLEGNGSNDAAYTTVNQSEIYSSEDAGIVVSGTANEVRVVSTAVGGNAAGNKVGIDVQDDVQEGTALVRIGVLPIVPTAPIVGLPVTAVAANQFTVGKNTATDVLRAGHQFYDRITNRLWQVTSVAPLADEAGYSIGVSGPSLAAAVGATIRVEAGYFVDAIARSATLRLPAGFPVSGLYLGQPVGSSVDGVVPVGARIKAIRPFGSNQFEIDLTEPVASTARVAVLFGASGRNFIGYNNDGVVLGARDTSIVQTDIAFSVFDGLVVDDVRSGGGHTIGNANGTTLDRSNAAIFANGLAGIRFSDDFFAGLGSLPEKLSKAGQVTIRGNYLGTNTVQATGLANGIDGASNIVFADPAVQQELFQNSTRGTDDRYLARHRPEDDRIDPERADNLDRDREGNFHFSGDPVIVAPGTGGGFSGGGDDDGWWNNLPTLR